MRFGLMVLLMSQVAVTLSAGSAHASSRVRCDSLLSSTALTSVTGPAKLSGSAQSYVSLIHLYLKHANSQFATKTIDEILNSKQLINPFSGRGDSFSVQLSDAIEKIRLSISEKDWRSIQAAIKDLIKKAQAESNNRQNAEENTQAIFKPQFIDKKSVKGNIASSPAWQIVDDRIFVVVADDYRIYLYELSEGQLKLLEIKRPKEGFGYVTPVWQVVNNKIFLAVSSSTGTLYLFELIRGKLELKSRNQHYENGSEVLTSPAWQIVGDRAFIAIATDKHGLRLYEVMGRELVLRASENIEAIYAQPSWQVIGERVFLAVGTSEGMRLYELVNESLVLKAFKKTVKPHFSSPSWQLVDGRAFVASGSNDGKLYLYEFANEKLTQKSIRATGKMINSKPSWYSVGSRTFVAIGSHDFNVYLYELVGKDLIEIDKQSTGLRIESSPTWLTFDDRIVLSVSSVDSQLYFYEFVNDQLVLLSTLKTKDSVKSDVLYIPLKDKEAYATVGSYDRHLYLIELFQKTEKKNQ